LGESSTGRGVEEGKKNRGIEGELILALAAASDERTAMARSKGEYCQAEMLPLSLGEAGRTV